MWGRYNLLLQSSIVACDEIYHRVAHRLMRLPHFPYDSEPAISEATICVAIRLTVRAGLLPGNLRLG